MAREAIRTVTGILTDSDYDEVTGTSYAVPGGVKRALDVSLTGGSASYVPSGLRNGGKVTEVTINDSSWTALPATPLSARNHISIQNYTGKEVKLNFDNTEPLYKGVILPDQGDRHYDITDSIPIYAKAEAGAGSITLIIEEIS